MGQNPQQAGTVWQRLRRGQEPLAFIPRRNERISLGGFILTCGFCRSLAWYKLTEGEYVQRLVQTSALPLPLGRPGQAPVSAES